MNLNFLSLSVFVLSLTFFSLLLGNSWETIILKLIYLGGAYATILFVLSPTIVAFIFGYRDGKEGKTNVKTKVAK